jgi:hypothetical protein
MALAFVGIGTVPNYTCLSTDIESASVTGAIRVGSTIYVTDNGEWYIVEPDLTLAPYSLPISLSGTISIGAVAQGTASLTERWLVDGSGVTQPVSGTVTTLNSQMSVVDASNSTSTPLLANGLFDGEFADLTGYTNISIMVKTDVDSAVNGLMVHWSTDGVNHDGDTDVFTVRANKPKQFSFGVTAKYAHIEYLNGASPQGTFRLQFMKHVGAPKPSSHRVDDIIVPEDDAELVKAVLTAKSPDGSFKNMNASMDGTLMVGIDDVQADAGGRVRVSGLTTLGDYKIMGYDRTATMWSSVGTGTGTWTANKFSMSVTSGQYWVRQTKRFHPYFSGKSQLVEETFYAFAPQTNVTKRVGYFSTVGTAPYESTLDGFWIESSAGSISLRSARAGTSTLNVDITNWSGYANLAEYKNLATWDNFTVIMFDFLWLGGAVLRLWVKTSNGFVLAHIFHYAGTAQDVFILSPNQPIRYDIYSSTGSGQLYYVCSQIATEGSINESGASRFVDTGTSLITTAVTGTTYPVKAIRKATAYRDVPVLVVDMDTMVGSANDRGIWSLQLNPTLSAPLTYSALADSPIEQATGNGTITVTSSGIVIAGGAVQSGAGIVSSQLELNYLSWLGSTVNNVMDAYVLCITPLSGSMTSFSGMSFKIY